MECVYDFVHIKYNKRTKCVYYIVHTEYVYYSERYNKTIICPVGMVSDGATVALDIASFAWLVHDRLCNTGKFSDGSECKNWQASSVCSDVLKRDGFWFRARSWKYATFSFGGGKARKNGML